MHVCCKILIIYSLRLTRQVPQTTPAASGPKRCASGYGHPNLLCFEISGKERNSSWRFSKFVVGLLSKLAATELEEATNFNGHTTYG